MLCGQAEDYLLTVARTLREKRNAGSEKSYVNSYIRLEITNQMMNCRNFLLACNQAAYKDDGKLDKQEKKQLEKLEKVTRKYVKELEKVTKG